MSIDIKICGLKTTDALDAALGAGADMVGVVFFPKSPRNVDLATAATLAERARGRAKVVALTVDADDALLTDIVREVRPDALQLHGKESVERVVEIRRRFGLPVIKAVGIGSIDDIERALAYADVADQLLLDAKAPIGAALPGGNGVPFDWNLLSRLDLSKPFMLSGGLHTENVAEALRLTSAPGVDVSSGVESAPGVKDPARITAFIEAARAAARETQYQRAGEPALASNQTGIAS